MWWLALALKLVIKSGFFFFSRQFLCFLSLFEIRITWLTWLLALLRNTHEHTHFPFSEYFISHVILLFFLSSSYILSFMFSLFSLSLTDFTSPPFFSLNFTDSCFNRLINTLRFFFFFFAFSPVVSDHFKGRLCIFMRLWYWSLNQVLFLDCQKLFTIMFLFLSTWLQPPVNIYWQCGLTQTGNDSLSITYLFPRFAVLGTPKCTLVIWNHLPPTSYHK